MRKRATATVAARLCTVENPVSRHGRSVWLRLHCALRAENLVFHMEPKWLFHTGHGALDGAADANGARERIVKLKTIVFYSFLGEPSPWRGRRSLRHPCPVLAKASRWAHVPGSMWNQNQGHALKNSTARSRASRRPRACKLIIHNIRSVGKPLGGARRTRIAPRQRAPCGWVGGKG